MTNILKNKSLVLILVTPIEKALLASCTATECLFCTKRPYVPVANASVYFKVHPVMAKAKTHLLVFTHLSFKKLADRARSHTAAIQRLCQQPPPLLLDAHAQLTPDGQGTLPGHIDQRHTQKPLPHLIHQATEAYN